MRTCLRIFWTSPSACFCLMTHVLEAATEFSSRRDSTAWINLGLSTLLGLPTLRPVTFFFFRFLQLLKPHRSGCFVGDRVAAFPQAPCAHARASSRDGLAKLALRLRAFHFPRCPKVAQSPHDALAHAVLRAACQCCSQSSRATRPPRFCPSHDASQHVLEILNLSQPSENSRYFNESQQNSCPKETLKRSPHPCPQH